MCGYRAGWIPRCSYLFIFLGNYLNLCPYPFLWIFILLIMDNFANVHWGLIKLTFKRCVFISKKCSSSKYCILQQCNNSLDWIAQLILKKGSFPIILPFSIDPFNEIRLEIDKILLQGTQDSLGRSWTSSISFCMHLWSSHQNQAITIYRTFHMFPQRSE